MGAKQTKFEGEYLPDTPTIKAKSATMPRQYFVQQQFDEENKDPRSPSGCRTPLNLYYNAPRPQLVKKQVIVEQAAQVTQPATSSENAFGILRKRLLKGFSNDPRSPQLNRTPMIFDETIDRTLKLDDTFADLFVDSRAPVSENDAQTALNTSIKEQTDTETIAQIDVPHDTHNNSSVEIVSLPYEEEETMPCPAVLQHTPLVLQQQFDPRSPTVGVDRTPIIFNDDDEIHEDQMLENILETLTLNLSNDSSMASFVSANAEESTDTNDLEPEIQVPTAQSLTTSSKLTNKHLDRVRLGNKQRVPPRKPARRRPQQPVLIYEDNNENAVDTKNATSTPKKDTDAKNADGMKRTPLSCVKNRANTRSRSVENFTKSRKSKLPLQSFDDQLNPVHCGKMKNMHILQTAEDFLEASIY